MQPRISGFCSLTVIVVSRVIRMTSWSCEHLRKITETPFGVLPSQVCPRLRRRPISLIVLIRMAPVVVSLSLFLIQLLVTNSIAFTFSNSEGETHTNDKNSFKLGSSSLKSFFSLASISVTIQIPTEQSQTCRLSMTTAPQTFRSVKKVLPRPGKHWVGDGFHVYPVFANLAFTKELSPMLMFDYAEPKKFTAKVGQPRGVGQHPHRGQETVTLCFAGEVEHHDSTGNSGVIKELDVQWMTAGRGIIHEEYHSKDFTREGGVMEMVQLWVNLPKKHKMTKPRYQSITKDKIPVVPLPLGVAEDAEKLGTARIIAGSLGDTKGPAKTFSPVELYDISLPRAGSQVDIPFQSDHNAIVFVRRGRISIHSEEDKEEKLGPQDVALMSMDGGNTIRVRAEKSDTSILVMGGEPIDEPIANMGPFVMNTQQELDQAITDYRMGKFGK